MPHTETGVSGKIGRMPFVGRESEMRFLSAHVKAVRQGGSVVLLAGEPGIGKTRLCDELATGAEAGGARVLWGRCFEGEGAPAFWPWVQILRAYLRGGEGADLLAQLGPAAADLSQLVANVRDTRPLPAPTVTDAAQARFRLFDSIATSTRSSAWPNWRATRCWKCWKRRKRPS